MNQTQIDREVAFKTGETISEIARRGFGLDRLPPFGSVGGISFHAERPGNRYVQTIYRIDPIFANRRIPTRVVAFKRGNSEWEPVITGLKIDALELIDSH